MRKMLRDEVSDSGHSRSQPERISLVADEPYPPQPDGQKCYQRHTGWCMWQKVSLAAEIASIGQYFWREQELQRMGASTLLQANQV